MNQSKGTINEKSKEPSIPQNESRKQKFSDFITKYTSSKLKVLLVMLVASLPIVSAGIIIRYLQSTPLSVSQNDLNSPSLSDTWQTPIPDPTEKWIHYTNNTYLYSINSPQEISVSKDDNFLTVYSETQAPQLSLHISAKTTDLALSNAVENYTSSICCNIKKEVVIFNNLQSIKVTQTIEGPEKMEAYFETLFIKKDSVLYKINISYSQKEIPTDKRQLLDQILSTFQLLPDTTGWKTYTNKEYGFEFKYPSLLSHTSSGPNASMQKINQGKEISGTQTPSFDTISFSDEQKNNLFTVEVFSELEKNIDQYDFQEDYLYMNGVCDLRWGFTLDSYSIQGINYLKYATAQGHYNADYTPGGASPEDEISCYYVNNHHLIVMSSMDKATIDNGLLEQILSTFKFIETNEFPPSKEIDAKSQQLLEQIVNSDFTKDIQWENGFTWTIYLAREQPWGWAVNGTAPVDWQFGNPSPIEAYGWKFVDSADAPGGSGLRFSKVVNGVERILYFGYQSDFLEHKKPTDVSLFINDSKTPPSRPDYK